MNQNLMEKARALSAWANNTGSKENLVIAMLALLFPDATPEEQTKYLELFKSKPDDTISKYELMEAKLLSVRRAYEDDTLKPLLSIRIQIVAEINKDLSPLIDSTYWCETCGSHSGQCHPDTGYCFVCDTDNWEPENWRHSL